ncbi:hypothetical protein PPL_06844 [Heterostelium album PN500]|uniref:Serine protease n=1 Tax=Heterostelium pallidum (strain ATCC 26659 / Pp 5 / PN500) TaxID=670386 RepID=D3BDP2_HETP5|nr:hypothetical protein PPL_06844 [Heterostelium album PN500]EFA80023.1 hypothetical protein PPL_06844 [Heterostelium album PN500]|eukprot:XP_020432143.1 hypothetical protein PPL_06844 [Heterostelium album PN500]
MNHLSKTIFNFVFNFYSKLLIEIKSYCNISNKYQVPGTVEPLWTSGTGICVRKDLVMTAGHLLKLKYEKIYIYFGNDATINFEVFLNKMDVDYMYELESCGRDFDQIFHDPFIVTDFKGNQHNWILDNDLEVLRFKGKKPKKIDILFPMLPTNDLSVDHYVMGYPGYVTLDEFIAKHNETTANLTDLENLYNQVINDTRYFQKKTVCIGEVNKSDKKVITHRCPTLGGMSGGIFANIEHKRKFLGVHLGGAQDIGNFAISVTHPLFWYLYEKYVLDDQFIKDKKNRKHLKEYLDYFNYKHSLQKVFDQDGKIIGQIVPFNSRSKLVKVVANKEFYEKTSGAVGRIFIKYQVPGKVEPVWTSGTGFCVKKDLVMTAGHILTFEVDTTAPIETQEMQRNLKYEKVYIYFGNDATMGVEVILNKMDVDYMYELESCGRDFEQLFKDPFSVTDFNGKPNNWIPANDLEVLRFKGTPPASIDILFPMLPTNDLSVDHYVMGYPGHVNLDKFITDHKGTSVKLIDLENLYKQVFIDSNHFERKTVCIGKVIKSEMNVITHRCPTLGGTSGGIFASSQHERKFIGVHLGGGHDIGNLAISVTHPLFWYLYKTYVLDDQFIQDNRKHLEQYLIYFNHIKIYIRSLSNTNVVYSTQMKEHPKNEKSKSRLKRSQN